MDMGKSYQATITLGESTTTEDQTGEIEKVNISSNTITYRSRSCFRRI